MKTTSLNDDNYTIRWNNDLLTAKVELEVSLSVITAWFKASGLKVNESKTEICLFSRGDQVPIDISLNGKILTTKLETTNHSQTSNLLNRGACLSHRLEAKQSLIAKHICWPTSIFL